MAGWLNRARSTVDPNTPSVDLKFAWGGSSSSGGGFSFAEGAWFFYNVTDGTYLFGPVSLGSSGDFEQVVPIQYGKQYLITAVGRDSHQNYDVHLNNPHTTPNKVYTCYGAGGGGTNRGPHGFSVTIGPVAPPDSTPPSIHFTFSGSATDAGSFYTTADSSAQIKVQIQDSETGPKSFDYDVVKYDFDGSSLSENSRTSHSHTGDNVDVPLDPDFIVGVDVKNARDMANNPSIGISKSTRYTVAPPAVEVSNEPTPAPTAVSGCVDLWQPGYPIDGIVTASQLASNSKILAAYETVWGTDHSAGQAAGYGNNLEWALDWYNWITGISSGNSALHSQGSKETAASNPGGGPKTIADCFSTNPGDWNRSGGSSGWYSGLFARGQEGSSQYMAGWLGTKAPGQFFPNSVAFHLHRYGIYWGYGRLGGQWGSEHIRNTGRASERLNCHRRRDAWITQCIVAWQAGWKYPPYNSGTYSGSSNGWAGSTSTPSDPGYNDQPCGIDEMFINLGITLDSPGNFKIEDCLPPVDVNVSVVSATVLAGNGKEYYVDYPNTQHICHFEVEATDMEYGLKEAIFTPIVDDVRGTPETIAFPSAPYQGTAIAGPFEVDTENKLKISVEVEVFDDAGNSTTETLTPLDISIDDGEPQGGTVSGSGQTNASNSTTTPGLKLVDPGWMVSNKPYYDSKVVDIMVEYEDEYSGVDEAKLYINGTVESSVTLPSKATAEIHNQTYTITNSNLVEGINNAQLWLKDLATNEWFSNTLDFYIDETKPVCFIDFSPQDTILQNNSKYWTKENSINVDLTYDDVGPDPSGIDKGLIVVNGSAPTSVSDFSMSLSGTSKIGHTVSSLTVGQNDIDFYTIDKTENISNKNTITVWVDQTDAIGTMTRVESISTYSDDKIYTNTNKFDVQLTMDDTPDSDFF